MPLKIIRNDITQMNTDAIVNTANQMPIVGRGCDYAIHKAAGYDELLNFRRNEIGEVAEGQSFVTPSFNLCCKMIIHTVSPLYTDGNFEEEEKLRSCYKTSLNLAVENNVNSIAFPLISTGSFLFPKEMGLRIAIDEINAFLINHQMMVYLVVFDEKATSLGASIVPGLEEYIDQNYVEFKQREEYAIPPVSNVSAMQVAQARPNVSAMQVAQARPNMAATEEAKSSKPEKRKLSGLFSRSKAKAVENADSSDFYMDFIEANQDKLKERLAHTSDTFSQYLLYLIESKGMTNADVYNRAIVDKKVFSKIKNNENYHPQKLTALCLCVGAKLNLDETKDLLARAGYALSPCEKIDIIFSFFIENQIYDMVELDIQLEEHGLPCIIS